MQPFWRGGRSDWPPLYTDIIVIAARKCSLAGVCAPRGGGRAFLGPGWIGGGRHYAKEMVSSVIPGSWDGQRWSHSGHVAEELFLPKRLRPPKSDGCSAILKEISQLSLAARNGFPFLLEDASFRLFRSRYSARRDSSRPSFSFRSYYYINIFLGVLKIGFGSRIEIKSCSTNLQIRFANECNDDLFFVESKRLFILSDFRIPLENWKIESINFYFLPCPPPFAKINERDHRTKKG